MRLLSIAMLVAFLLTGFSCSKDGGINLFSVEDDVALGQQLRDEILNNPQEYPVLSRANYPSAYNYIDGIVNEIVTSGQLNYPDQFAWEVYIIDDNDVLNAFAAPGGYIFVYTGLIDFLDSKDDFVGVLAHEMAHADERHATEQLTQSYGISFLLDFLLGGDSNIAADIAASLVSLKFSRGDEEEADAQSVEYLCETQYAANATASFFAKLLEEGNAASPPTFLSTHPSPENRVSDINTLAQELGCDTTPSGSQQEWNQFQQSLP